MNTDYFSLDFIGDMCNAPGSSTDYILDQNSYLQSSQLSYSSAYDVNVNVGFSAQDEIRPFECSLLDQWNQHAWGGDYYCDSFEDIACKSEYREGIEDALRPSTTSDSDTTIGSLGSLEDDPLITPITTLAMGSDKTLCKAEYSALDVESLLVDSPPSTGDKTQNRENAAQLAQHGRFQRSPLPLVTSHSHNRSGTGPSQVKQEPVAPTLDSPDLYLKQPSCRKKAEQGIVRQHSQFSPPRLEAPVGPSNNVPYKKNGSSLGNAFMHDSSGIRHRRACLSPPKTSLSDAALVQSSRRETNASRYNLRKRTLALQPKFPLSEMYEVPLPAGRSHRTRTTVSSEKSGYRQSASGRGTHSARTTATLLGKQSRQLDCDDSNSNEDQPQTRRRRPSDEEPAKNDLRKAKELEARLLSWGFVVEVNRFRCPCGSVFTRRWDAVRHWRDTLIHKAERLKTGDKKDFLKNQCKTCGEILSRKDALKRHIPKCGLRRKRASRYGVGPTGDVI